MLRLMLWWLQMERLYQENRELERELGMRGRGSPMQASLDLCMYQVCSQTFGCDHHCD